jgi:tetratricopeptide (TPR) repeat protein
MDVLDDLQTAFHGRYEIARELGRGGMAVVYLARDLKHDRQVAIKVLPPEMASTVGAERFLREIRTAAQLSHPNILPLHDSIAVDRVRAYVMPYVEGESLRQRLDRERQLGIEQAVDIARQVAAGLDYAHAHGIIHRDIKPENILLVGNQAVIADFGLALATYSASSTPFTATGLAVGTPAYMSPEQAAADRAVDGRADIYALGCVFFEMVAGVPPFRGATAGALLSAHATRTPPSLCAERESCPPGMDAAVRRALAKLPADRFRTAGEFAHALESARLTPPSTLVVEPRAAPLPWLVGVAAVAALALVTPTVTERIALARTPLDSNRVMMLPVDGTGGRHVTTAVARQRLTSALMEWRDLRVVEPPASTVAGADASEGSRIARRAGASRFLATTAALMGDSVELRATLYDARGDPVREQTLRVADDLRSGGERYRALVTNLLRTSDGEDDADDANPGTTRVAAWRAFTRGDSLWRAWSLADAEKEFRRAVTLDPTFGRAHLWLGQVILWERPERSSEWGDEAGLAERSIGQLGERDSLLANGLAALASARYPDACRAYRRLHAEAPQNGLAWYGLGYCLGLDPIVERDATSPSGWRFRNSPTTAADALDSAIAKTEGAPEFAFRMLGRLLVTESSRLRLGRAASPETTSFYAHPSWDRDSVAYVPYPVSTIFQSGARIARKTLSVALQRNIARLLSDDQEWVRRAPASAEARAALAREQELIGGEAPREGAASLALTTLLEARRLSHDPREQLKLANVEVRLLVKYSLFRRAHWLADSLLTAIPRADSAQAALLAAVAALVGQVDRTSQLIRTRARSQPRDVFPSRMPIPAPVLDAASAFLAAASLGVCDSNVRSYPATLKSLVNQYVPNDQRDEVLNAVILRSITLGVPCLGTGAVLGLRGQNLLLSLQQSLASGQRVAMVAQLERARASRLGARPGDLAMDHLYHESWLLVHAGRELEAGRNLDEILTALSTISTAILDVDQVPAAASLGRALALGAQLAVARADTSLGACYARAVTELWAGASSELQPLVQQMRATARLRPGDQRSHCSVSEPSRTTRKESLDRWLAAAAPIRSPGLRRGLRQSPERSTSPSERGR